MQYNEFHHAYLVGYFYDELNRAFGKQGIAAFIKATQLYGEQRGGRMALRAIRDGHERTYDAYFHYVEWQATPGFAKIARSVTDGVMLSENFVCPWHTALKEMGLTDCGAVYCQYIDASLVRGFNPALKFEAASVLHTSPTCRLYFHIGESVSALPESRHPVVFDMEYHCAHLFWTFSRVVTNIFGSKGDEIITHVKSRFAQKYSEDMAAALEAYADCDFTYLPDEKQYEKHIVR